MYKIINIAKNSPAEKKGIKKGDYLMSINNKSFDDVLDYLYLTSEENISLKIITQSGMEKIIAIKNRHNSSLGIEFEYPTIDKPKSCENNCVFCFINQLPKNLRASLYFKDDDYRLCFLHGNYISLTNTSQNDLERIVKLRLSPVNMSVHTTNPDLRVKMLNNKNAADIINKIEYFYKNGIEMQVQIVLCPGLNDGDELIKTLNDLMSFYPAVISVSVVDVGLTKFRKNLYPLTSVDSAAAAKTIDIISDFQNKMYNTYNTRWVFCSDEMYIKANKKIPSYEFYEEFLQFQNGVGFIASFNEEFLEELNALNNIKTNITDISAACGLSIGPYLKHLCDMAAKKYNIKIRVYEVKNNFFGQNITCSGLLTGKDIISSLKGNNLGQLLLLPSTAFKSGTDIMLDDFTISDLEKELKIKIKTVPQNGADFLRILLNLK